MPAEEARQFLNSAQLPVALHDARYHRTSRSQIEEVALVALQNVG